MELLNTFLAFFLPPRSDHPLSSHSAGHCRFKDEIHLNLIPSLQGCSFASNMHHADLLKVARQRCVWGQVRGTQRTYSENFGPGKMDPRG